MTNSITRLLRAARDDQREYANGADRPLGGYLTLMGVYGGTVTALGVAARLSRRRLPERLSPWDVVQLAAATHKISRLLSQDPVTSPLRAPFTTYEGVQGAASLSEEARGAGVRHALGELITCPFCLSQWIATGLTAGLVFTPRFARLVAGMFATLAGADLLQYARVQAEKTA